MYIIYLNNAHCFELYSISIMFLIIVGIFNQYDKSACVGTCVFVYVAYNTYMCRDMCTYNTYGCRFLFRIYTVKTFITWTTCVIESPHVILIAVVFALFSIIVIRILDLISRMI